MTNNQIKELMEKGIKDGAQLFSVADVVYKVSIVLNIIILSLGVIAFFSVVKRSLDVAIAVAIITVIFCAFSYAGAVLACNGAKVLVHTLFANLALLEKLGEKEQ